jgi:ABC-2 type transport system ATP-binding protein
MTPDAIMRAAGSQKFTHFRRLMERATVFVSSHVMSEVQQTADRVGITRGGRLAGHTDELVKAAARYRVRDLLGEEPDLEEIFVHYYARPEADHVAA